MSEQPQETAIPVVATVLKVGAELTVDHLTFAVKRVTLLYVCPDCGVTAEQALSGIVQNGTLTCDCGVDMELQENVEITSERCSVPSPSPARK